MSNQDNKSKSTTSSKVDSQLFSLEDAQIRSLEEDYVSKLYQPYYVGVMADKIIFSTGDSEEVTLRKQAAFDNIQFELSVHGSELDKILDDLSIIKVEKESLISSLLEQTEGIPSIESTTAQVELDFVEKNIKLVYKDLREWKRVSLHSERVQSIYVQTAARYAARSSDGDKSDAQSFKSTTSFKLNSTVFSASTPALKKGLVLPSERHFSVRPPSKFNLKIKNEDLEQDLSDEDRSDVESQHSNASRRSSSHIRTFRPPDMKNLHQFNLQAKDIVYNPDEGYKAKVYNDPEAFMDAMEIQLDLYDVPVSRRNALTTACVRNDELAKFMSAELVRLPWDKFRTEFITRASGVSDLPQERISNLMDFVTQYKTGEVIMDVSSFTTKINNLATIIGKDLDTTSYLYQAIYRYCLPEPVERHLRINQTNGKVTGVPYEFANQEKLASFCVAAFPKLKNTPKKSKTVASPATTSSTTTSSKSTVIATKPTVSKPHSSSSSSVTTSKVVAAKANTKACGFSYGGETCTVVHEFFYPYVKDDSVKLAKLLKQCPIIKKWKDSKEAAKATAKVVDVKSLIVTPTGVISSGPGDYGEPLTGINYITLNRLEMTKKTHESLMENSFYAEIEAAAQPFVKRSMRLKFEAFKGALTLLLIRQVKNLPRKLSYDFTSSWKRYFIPGFLSLFISVCLMVQLRCQLPIMAEGVEIYSGPMVKDFLTPVVNKPMLVYPYLDNTMDQEIYQELYCPQLNIPYCGSEEFGGVGSTPSGLEKIFHRDFDSVWLNSSQPNFKLFPLKSKETPDRNLVCRSEPEIKTFSINKSIKASLRTTVDPILIPFLLNEEKIYGLMDSGASHTVLNKAFVESLNISCVMTEFEAKTAKVGTILSIFDIPKGVLELKIGNLKLPGPFYVGDIGDISDTYQALIGRDLQKELGIGFTNVPAYFPGEEPELGFPYQHEDEVKDNIVGEEIIDGESHKILMDKIEKSLRRNEEIPVGEFCTHPLALVNVDLKPGTKPVHVRQYTFAKVFQPSVDAQVKKWYELGIICHAPKSTQWNIPLLPVSKKDPFGKSTEVRVCGDMRPVNNCLTSQDRLTLPLISDIIERVVGHPFITSVDLMHAFNQLPVNPEHRHILAFTWGGIQYMFKGAPFGLTPIPHVMQRLTSELIKDFRDFCPVYIDDIFIYSNTLQEHIVHVNKVLDKLTEFNLKIRREKCHFGRKQVLVLGRIISQNGVTIDPKKIIETDEAPVPVTGKQVGHWLGVFGFLRDSIPLYASLSQPLERIKGLNDVTEHFLPGSECLNMFNKLKAIIRKNILLSTPDFTQPFMVATDASNVGIGAILYQEIDGEKKFISFVSRALRTSERNYSATKRELLGITFALNKFHYYLYGVRFTLFTDHKALVYLFTQKQTNAMINQWYEVLLTYDFSIVHLPGILNVLPDHLSRLYPEEISSPPNVKVKDDKNALYANKTFRQHMQVMMNDVSLTTPTNSFSNEAGDILDENELSFSPELLDDHYSIPALHKSNAKDILESFSDPSSIDMVQFDNLEVVEDIVERNQIMSQVHSLGHFGAAKMKKSIHSSGKTWPKLLEACQKVVMACADCQRYNLSKVGFHPLTSINATLPLDHIAIDLNSHDTSNSGNNYSLVVTDVCTRFTWLRALQQKTAIAVARELFKLFCEVGFPKILQSDNGTEFVNKVIAELVRLVSVEHRLTTPYHPRANGLAEANVKISSNIMKKHVEGKLSSWDIYLPSVQFMMNIRVSDLTKSTPFSLLYGRKFNGFGDYRNVDSSLLTEVELEKRMQVLTELVYPTVTEITEKNQALLQKQWNARHKIVTDAFPDGSFVMIRNLTKKGKWDQTWNGPLKVMRRNQGGAYILQDSTGALLPKNIPPSQMKLIDRAGNAGFDDTYEVDSVLNHRREKNVEQYLVKWKHDHPPTWEKVANFNDYRPIREYWQRRGLTPTFSDIAVGDVDKKELLVPEVPAVPKAVQDVPIPSVESSEKKEKKTKSTAVVVEEGARRSGRIRFKDGIRLNSMEIQGSPKFGGVMLRTALVSNNFVDPKCSEVGHAGCCYTVGVRDAIKAEFEVGFTFEY